MELISPITAGIVAALVSYFLWKKRFAIEFSAQKTSEFLEKQLSEFYGPMVICIKRVRATGELRQEEFSLFDKYAIQGSQEDTKKHSELIQKHNREFTEILSLWERMVELFSSKGHLADPDILEGFDQFFKFVKGWKDHLDQPISQRLPFQAAKELSERYPEPIDFYKLIESQYNDRKEEHKKLTS